MISFLFLDPCINVLCHAGQECVVVDNNATCMCKESCPDHEKPVCGSNGITFPNHCELHRTSCLEGKKISIKYDGECKGQPTQPPLTAKNNHWKPSKLNDFLFLCFELLCNNVWFLRKYPYSPRGGQVMGS